MSKKFKAMTDKVAPNYFDGRAAIAIVVAPIIPLVIHTHAVPLLLPVMILSLVGNLVVHFAAYKSGRDMALFVALGLFNLVGWSLLGFQVTRHV